MAGPGEPGGVDETALAEAAARVYAVTPEEFMPVRTELVQAAKAAGDKALAAEIGRLRKPSVAAWALNLLAHEGIPLLGELADLGDRMRSATSRMDVAELTAVRPERDRLLAELVSAAVGAVAEAGRSLSAAGQDEVRDTGIAALADTDAQAAIESGTLVRTLSYSGFGEVDVADAVAVTSTGRVLGVIRGGGGESDPVEGAGDDDGVEGSRHARDTEASSAGRDPSTDPAARRAAAQEALEAAEAAVTDANAAVAEAEELAESATERREAAQRQLDKAEAAESAAKDRVMAAKRARRAAEEARHAAEETLDALAD